MIREDCWVRQIEQKFSDQRKDRTINTKKSKLMRSAKKLIFANLYIWKVTFVLNRHLKVK